MKFGVQLKLVLLLVFFALVFFGAIIYGLSGIRQISEASLDITQKELPLSRGIEAALVALLKGKVALEQTLQTSEFQELPMLQEQEAELFGAIVEFDAYTGALTWGSESEAFLKSDGGLNAQTWNQLNATGDLTIQRPSADQAQRAALADLYFGGFVQNALKAVATHKRFLRLQEGQPEEAERFRAETAMHVDRAVRFSELVVASLSDIVRASNESIRRSEYVIDSARREIRNRILIVFIAGSLFSLFAGSVLVRRGIVGPLTDANHKLQEILHENYISAKLLVQKDRELVAVNRALEERNREFDETAKMLVRRDLELTGSNERLQELDEAKSQFVSVAAHQLRTPLSGIKWTLYTLLNGEVGALSEEQKKLMRDASKANDRLIELIRDLLDVARLEEGRFGFELVKTEFLPMVKGVKKKLEKQAREKGVALKLYAPKEKLPAVTIDEEKIAIALENFVENAIKYTPSGGRVDVTIIKEKAKITVEVRDTGIGIPKKELSKIFGKFFRAENAQLFQTSGTGLGLYVAKNIVEHHGGTVYVESEEGKGTAVSFSLPVSSSKNNTTTA